MIYDLSNDLSRKQASMRFQHFLDLGAVVELKEKTKRTLNQNRYLHLIIGILAMETGNSLEYAKQWYFKRVANPDLFIRRVHDKFVGEVEILRSSADLTKEEMSLAIDRFKIWSANQGIYLPDPDDYKNLQQIEIEMARCQSYL